MGYFVALVAVALAIGLRLALDPLLGDQMPLVTLLIAAAVVTWFCGRGPGMLTIVAGAIAAAYFLLTPRLDFAVEPIEYRTGLVLFCGIAIALVFLIESLQFSGTRAAYESELLQKALLSIGNGVITTDSEGHVTQLNSGAALLSGWTASEAYGKAVAAVFPVIDETTQQPVKNSAERALADGCYAEAAKHAVLVTRSGALLPINDSAFPIMGEDGGVVGSVLVFSNVSAKRQQERESEARDRQFHTLADSIPQLAFMADAEGHLFWYNRRWYDYTGTTFADMEGWGWQSVHDPQELPQVLWMWKACIASGDPFEMVFPLKGKDGEFRSFLTRLVPVHNEAGRVIRWLGTSTDITEQTQMQAQLRALASELSDASRRKDEFLATLAHELRNPLAPVRSALELMRRAGDNAALIQQSRLMIERQVVHLTRLVDDLLDIGRLTHGKLELKTERIDLKGLIGQAVDACRSHCAKAGHVLNVSLPSAPVAFLGDATRLLQALGNLLTNACKFTPRGGRIWLTATCGSDVVTVTVKDTGIGIEPSMLSSVFELFTQIKHGHEPTRGLGIGLSLTRTLAGLHGGTVVARSAGLGQGCEFEMRLPLRPDTQVPAPVAATTHSPPPTQRARILVVDDNADAADSLAELLTGEGYDTRIARDGQEAVEMAMTCRPDIVVLDIGLPKLDGYEVCRAIRRQPGGDRMRMIALSGWGQAEDRRKSSAAGFDEHLVKPVDFHQLLVLLETTATEVKDAPAAPPRSGILL